LGGCSGDDGLDRVDDRLQRQGRQAHAEGSDRAQDRKRDQGDQQTVLDPDRTGLVGEPALTACWQGVWCVELQAFAFTGTSARRGSSMSAAETMFGQGIGDHLAADAP
jgi:hypothetical protein